MTRKAGSHQLVSADVVLRNANMLPLELGPKERLAIVQSNAVSAGVASLALHDTHYLVVLSQIFAAVGVRY